MNFLRITLVGVAVMAGAIAATGALAARRMQRQYETEKAALLSRGRSGTPQPEGAAPLTTLPVPVQRYLEVTGRSTAPPPRVATLRQHGMLYSANDTPGMPFTAEQVYSSTPAGFVWFARATMAKVLPLYVRDRYVSGAGEMLVKLLGVLAVVNERGPELDQGAALRYWGEMLAFPEFVRDPRLRWEAIDDQRARLFIDDGPLQLEAVVEFANDGYLAAFHADRYRDVQGTGVLTPWSGHMRDWRLFGDRPFPSAWEAVWHLPEGDLIAVTMTITHVTVESP